MPFLIAGFYTTALHILGTILNETKINFEEHLLEGVTHTISTEAIDLLQKFIKKNL